MQNTTPILHVVRLVSHCLLRSFLAGGSDPFFWYLQHLLDLLVDSLPLRLCVLGIRNRGRGPGSFGGRDSRHGLELNTHRPTGHRPTGYWYLQARGWKVKLTAGEEERLRRRCRASAMEASCRQRRLASKWLQNSRCGLQVGVRQSCGLQRCPEGVVVVSR